MEASQWNIRSPAYSNVHVPVHTALYATVHVRPVSNYELLHCCCGSRPAVERVGHAFTDSTGNTAASMNRRAEVKHWLLGQVQVLRRCTSCCSARVRSCRY
jgi:hypothetical protein